LINHQLKFGRLLNRQVRWTGALNGDFETLNELLTND